MTTTRKTCFVIVLITVFDRVRAQLGAPSKPDTATKVHGIPLEGLGFLFRGLAIVGLDWVSVF